MPKPTEATWQQFLALSVRVESTITSFSDSSGDDGKPSDGYILSLFWRTVRLYKAALLLLKAELPEEALILGRSAFVDSLRLSELATDRSNKDALVLGWVNQSLEEEKGLVRAAENLGVARGTDQILTYLENQHAKLRQYARRIGVLRLRNFLQESAASRRFGRTDDYWAYLSAHHMVHGSDFALMVSRQQLEPGRIAVYLGNRDPVVLVDCTN